MSFLGRLAATGARFLGQATRVGTRFLGQAAPTVARFGSLAERALPYAGRAAETVANIAANPMTQQLGARIGIDPSQFRQVAHGATNVNNLLGALPGAARQIQGVVGDTARAVNLASNQIQSAVMPARQTLGELYKKASG